MQSRAVSFVETAANTVIGFVVSIPVTAVVLPWFGLHPSGGANFGIAAVYTAVSVVRGYLVRRMFERLDRGAPT